MLKKKCEWHGSKIPLLRVEVGVKLDEEERDYRGEKRPKKIVSTILVKRKKEDDQEEAWSHKKFRSSKEVTKNI